jgi:hypothetical protein
LYLIIKRNNESYFEGDFVKNAYYLSAEINLNDSMSIEVLDKEKNSWSIDKSYLSKDDISALFFQ